MPPPQITAIYRTDSGFTIEFSAAPGHYHVERATSLTSSSWEWLGEVKVLQGRGALSDSRGNESAVFYRIKDVSDSTRFQSIAFESSVASGGILGQPTYGGLWTGHSREELLYERTGASTGILHAMDGQFASFRIEPNNGAVASAYIERWADTENLPVVSGPGGLSVVSDGDTLRYRPLEGGDFSWIAAHKDVLEEESPGPSGTYRSTERSVEVIWSVAKSRDANPADLEGDWGFVMLSLEGKSVGNGFESVYTGTAFSSTLKAGAGSTLSFLFEDFVEFDVAHWLQSGDVEAEFGSGKENPPLPFELLLNPDASLRILSAEAGVDLAGMASPSAGLVVAAASTPGFAELPAGEDEIFLWGLNSVHSEWAIGVRRDRQPQLAGKTYRVIRQGWWIGGHALEVNSGGDLGRITFNAAGTSAVRTHDGTWEAVTFNGQFESDSDLIEVPMQVSVDAQGRVDLDVAFTNDGTPLRVRSTGYAQEGSDLLVLLDTITDGEGAGMGVIIAIRER